MCLTMALLTKADSAIASTHSVWILKRLMKKFDSIVLGGGCFWCLEAAYQQVSGVVKVTSGYAGGDEQNATYEVVSTGATDHVEVVKVSYDPAEISLKVILGIFWVIHDPTSLNQQGADIGPQYASVIFYDGQAQRADIEASMKEAQVHLDDPIVTRVEPLLGFYEAEAYHQNYFENNPGTGYCQVVIKPKLRKLRQHFSPLLKA
jgi:methionine-S-sulfoxide reductase